MFEIKITYKNGSLVEYVGNSIHIQPSKVSKGINIQIEEPEVNIGARLPAVGLDLLDLRGKSLLRDPLEI